MSVGGGVLHFYPHFPLKLLCVLGGGGLHCCNHFLELKFLCVVCVWGGGGGHLYQTFTWMCSNGGSATRHAKSDFRLQTLYP